MDAKSSRHALDHFTMHFGGLAFIRQRTHEDCLVTRQSQSPMMIVPSALPCRKRRRYRQPSALLIRPSVVLRWGCKAPSTIHCRECCVGRHPIDKAGHGADAGVSHDVARVWALTSYFPRNEANPHRGCPPQLFEHCANALFAQ